LPYVKLWIMETELVSGAEIGRRLGVTREAMRQWRCRPVFPDSLRRVGQAWDWGTVQRWAETRDRRPVASREASHG
jgi:hypothetical protein